MTFKTLYKLATTGKAQEWTIEVVGNKYRTISGQVGGKLTVSEFTECFGKNAGKANETTDNEQAVKEAEAKYKKKMESGYQLDLNSAGRAQYFEPMLANKWEDYKEDMEYPVAIQCKLDGIRCVITKDGMFSRNGKPIVSAPHIFESLKQFFKTYPSIVLDGELYNHELKYNFNKIVSLVKKTKPTQEDLDESETLIEYHCYDMFDRDNPTMQFVHRTARIAQMELGKYVVKVKTFMVPNEQKLDEHYAQFVEDGYEGGIIRNVKAPYENKRTKNLLKRKDFIDEEYTILDIVEGEGGRTGTAGYMVFKNKDGKQFKSNIKGDFEYLAQLLKDRKELIGKQATIKYFSLTPDAIPRFPYVIAVRDYD